MCNTKIRLMKHTDCCACDISTRSPGAVDRAALARWAAGRRITKEVGSTLAATSCTGQANG